MHLDTNSSNVGPTVEFLEHEFEEKITFLRRELTRQSDGNLTRVREEMNCLSEFFSKEIQTIRAQKFDSHKVCEEIILALEKKCTVAWIN